MLNINLILTLSISGKDTGNILLSWKEREITVYQEVKIENFPDFQINKPCGWVPLIKTSNSSI